jgi:hypothetical protein
MRPLPKISCLAPLLPKRSGRAPLSQTKWKSTFDAPSRQVRVPDAPSRPAPPLSALLMPTPICAPFAVPTLAGHLLPRPACPQFRHRPSHQSRPALPPTLHGPDRRPACSSAGCGGWSGCGAGRWCSARRVSASQLPTGAAPSPTPAVPQNQRFSWNSPPEMEKSER